VIWNFFSATKTAASERARSGVWCSTDVRDFLAGRSSAV
jgi:hypothetical protein